MTLSRISKILCAGILLAAANLSCGQPGGGGEGERGPGESTNSGEDSTRSGGSSLSSIEDRAGGDESRDYGSSSEKDATSRSGSNQGPPIDGSTSSSDGVRCDKTGGSADYQEILSGEGLTMTRNTSTSTGCPNHINWPLNPNQVTENPFSSTIPAYPMLMDANDGTDLSDATSPTGMMLNGVALFSSWGRVTVVSYDTTAFYIEGDSLDPCAGHANPNGMYHYHCTPGCLQEHAMELAGTTDKEHSPQLGWSYDGFPVYGQLGPEGTEMKMCGMDGAHDDYCLDWCSGYEGEVGVDDFKYRYYLSCGANESFFPFTTNCYRGCCPEGVECGGPHVEACGDNVTKGYTNAYVPSTATPLTEPYDTGFLDGNDSDYVGLQTPLDCSLYLGSWGKTETLAEGNLTTSAGNITMSPTASPTVDENITMAPTMGPTPVSSRNGSSGTDASAAVRMTASSRFGALSAIVLTAFAGLVGYTLL